MKVESLDRDLLLGNLRIRPTEELLALFGNLEGVLSALIRVNIWFVDFEKRSQINIQYILGHYKVALLKY